MEESELTTIIKKSETNAVNKKCMPLISPFDIGMINNQYYL